MKLFVSGTDIKNDESFEIMIDSVTAIELIDLVEDNADTDVAIMLARMDKRKSVVYEAITYLSDPESVIEKLENGTRFSVHMVDITFGVSGTSHKDAWVALDNQE